MELLEQLWKITAELSPLNDLNAAIKLVVDETTRAIGGDCGCLLFNDGVTNKFQVRYSNCEQPLTELEISTTDDNPLSMAMKANPGILIHDFASENKWAELTALPYGSLLAVRVPDSNPEDSYGAILIFAHQPDRFTQEHRHFIATIAASLGLFWQKQEVLTLVQDQLKRTSEQLKFYESQSSILVATLYPLPVPVLYITKSGSIILSATAEDLLASLGYKVPSFPDLVAIYKILHLPEDIHKDKYWSKPDAQIFNIHNYKIEVKPIYTMGDHFEFSGIVCVILASV
jgi:hypothetical protein